MRHCTVLSPSAKGDYELNLTKTGIVWRRIFVMAVREIRKPVFRQPVLEHSR